MTSIVFRIAAADREPYTDRFAHRDRVEKRAQLGRPLGEIQSGVVDSEREAQHPDVVERRIDRFHLRQEVGHVWIGFEHVSSYPPWPFHS